MRRINEFDYVRVVAIFFIMTCHYICSSSNLNDGIGRYFGGTGNNIFFLISAMLYGFIYNPVKYGEWTLYINRFVKSRILKLCSSLWPFLTILTILFNIYGINFSKLSLCLNYLLLGYLDKLPGNGHLWFFTVLMACYAEMVVIYRFRMAISRLFPWMILSISTIILLIGEKMGIPSGAFLTLGLYCFFYVKANGIFRISKLLKWWMIFVIFIINLFIIYYESIGLFEASRTAHFILTGLSGFSLLMVLIRLAPEKSNVVVGFFSKISFEIYLVHHTLCSGPFIMIPRLPYGHLLNYIILVAISIFLAYLLNRIGALCLKLVS